SAVGRHGLLMGAPPEFGRLQALRHEAFDRPGVDEDAAGLRIARALRIALGDVDALDAGALHQARPVFARLRLAGDAEVARHVDERLLDHPRHHAGVGAAAAHRGVAARPAPAQVEHAFAQRVVRTRSDRAGAVGVEAGPRLDHGVDVEGIDVFAE